MNPDQIDNATAIITACNRLSDVSLHGLGILLLGTFAAVFLIGLIVGYKVRDCK
jgi:hypothetical protein